MRQDDPYAGLGTVEQEAVDPYEGLGVVEIEPAPTPVPQPDTSLSQNVGVLTSALSPYATAAMLGAAAGAPFAGVGALPGAAGGVLSLGLADLGTGVYNAAAPMFGGQRVPLPSETIRSGYESVGIGRAPQTPGQEVMFRTAEGAASALGGASALGTLATRQAPGVTRNIMQQLAQQRGAQTAAGAGAGALPTAAQQYGDVTDPLALTGLSFAGGMAAGAPFMPRGGAPVVPAERLRQQAQAAYQRAEQAGVQFDPTSIADLSTGIRQSFTAHPSVQFDPILHPRINRALQRIDEVAAEAQTSGTPVSFSQLELLRRVGRTAANSMDRDERRLGYHLIRQIDDFVQAPPQNAIIAGAGDEAAAAIREARTQWRRMAQGDAIENIVTRATNSADGLNAASIRQQARNIANNENRMRQFDPDIQTQIRDLAHGKGGLGAAQSFGKLAPTINVRNLPAQALASGTGYGLYAGDPLLAGLGAVTAAGALGSRATANRMAQSRVQSMLGDVRGRVPQAPRNQIAAQSAMQALTQGAPAATAPVPAAPAEAVVPMIGEGQVLLGFGIGAGGEQYPIYGQPGVQLPDVNLSDISGEGRPFSNINYDEYGNYIGPRR
jgi:hypothetical protein